VPAAEADLALARGVAGRIVSLEGLRVRRVVMIGSRALGTARPDSDLDLVVLVEPPAGTPPWRSADFAAEGVRLRARIGAAPVHVDLWVRTTDRYAEACDVIGGVDWLAAREGIEVFGRPAMRPPGVVLTREQIRCQNVSAWVEHACAALAAAHRLGNAAAVSGGAGDAGEPAATVRLAIARAVTAVLVAHQVYVPASAGPDARMGASVARRSAAGRDASAAAAGRSGDSRGAGSPSARRRPTLAGRAGGAVSGRPARAAVWASRFPPDAGESSFC